MYCTSNCSHHCDDIRRSYAGWVFMVLVAGSFVHTLVSFDMVEASWWGSHDTGGERYITNCSEYKDAVGFVSVSIVWFFGDNVLSFMRRPPLGWSLSRTPPAMLWCFLEGLVFSWIAVLRVLVFLLFHFGSAPDPFKGRGEMVMARASRWLAVA